MRRIPKKEVVEYEKLTLEIPAEIKRNARHKAATEGRNITDIIMEALLNYLREYETRDKLKKLEARVAALEEKTKNL